MKTIFFLIITISILNTKKNLADSSANHLEKNDNRQILKIKKTDYKKKKVHIINPEFIRITRSKGKADENLELPKFTKKRVFIKKPIKDIPSISSEEDIILNQNTDNNLVQNLENSFSFTNNSMDDKLNFEENNINNQKFNLKFENFENKNNEDVTMEVGEEFNIDNDNFDLETMASESDMNDLDSNFEDNRFDIVSNKQKEFEKNYKNNDYFKSDSDGLFTFGIELESAEMVSKVADPESDDYNNAYINCNEWYLFNDSGRVFEIATKKGYSIDQIKKISFEIQLTWLKMISLSKDKKKYDFKKDELIVKVGNVEIKANRDFGIIRKKKIPWLSPQITMKLPLNKIKNLFKFFLNNDNKVYTGRKSTGPRSGRINQIIKKVYDINNGFLENGLTNLWLFYGHTLFYQKNEITQLNQFGESITVDINANDGSNLGFGPKQNVLMLSRIGFYDMFHKMSSIEQKEFIKNTEDICNNRIDCDKLVVIKYMNIQDEEDSLFKGQIINNSLTLREWTDSIINGDENFKNQRKLDLTLGQNVTVANTDKLSPPLGFRSSNNQEYSDYDELKGIDRIYGMGCMTNIKQAEVNGIVQNETLALLEFRDYAHNKMRGNFVVEYITTELEGIMNAVQSDELII